MTNNNSGEQLVTSKQFMKKVFAGKETGRIPFAPAVYEHKAFLIDKTPSEVAKDPELLTKSIFEEYSVYHPDLLTVGLDVYNVEAEAMGGEVKYYPDSCDVPVFQGPIVNSETDLKQLSIPEPRTDGRMPLMLEAGRRVREKLCSEVLIRGAISGPFTLACSLAGQERIIIEAYKKTSFIKDLLEKATQVILKYAKAWIDIGLEMIMFDSLASPPLVPPDIYRNIIKPYHQKIYGILDKFELSHKPLIIGGDTTKISSELADVGADLLLCDYNANLDKYLDVAEREGISLRVNLDPQKIKNGAPGELEALATEVAKQAKRFNRFILGTGVLVYDTPVENVMAVKQVCEDRDIL
ncbi:MAG: uroporphyrinogen decarboxylase family protein [Candidatus Bipolaricaulota bacterium]|nr:hypothetical protein [Candidatus Bipolaricaulota bacterium]